MVAELFVIRSVSVQNVIMGVAIAIAIGFLVYFIMQRKSRHALAATAWLAIVLWFFNSPLWGFSAVTVSINGLRIDYGFLSIAKNSVLPLDTQWKIRVYMGGTRRLEKLYYIQLANHLSLKVSDNDRLAVMKSLGAAIDQLNGRPMGEFDPRPVNM